MAHISGADRSQLLLLPDAVDDYVGPDNPVRFIDAFVDGLDLVEAGFERVRPKRTGRPGYYPADLLKLYIYGYLNRIRSSRRLEAETHRNLEVIWTSTRAVHSAVVFTRYAIEESIAKIRLLRQYRIYAKKIVAAIQVIRIGFHICAKSERS